MADVSRNFTASAAAQLMSCAGSGNLEEAIPGWVDPPEKTKGASPIGTAVHEYLAEAVGWMTVPEVLSRMSGLVEVFQGLHYKKRARVIETQDSWREFLEAELTAFQLSKLRYAQLQLRTVATDRALYAWTVGVSVFTPKMMRYIADTLEELAWYARKSPIAVFSEMTVESRFLVKPRTTTPDVIILLPLGRLVVIDFKTGAIPVEAEDNDQLLYYLASVLSEQNRFALAMADITSFTAVILQPGGNSTASVTREELAEWTAKALETEAKIARKDLTLTPSANCTFCPANPQSRGEKGTPLCPAMLERLYPTFIDPEDIYGDLTD